MKTRFINLFGAPGVGKSTIAAGIYSKLSARGWNIELVPEFAKELVWESNASALSNQAYVTARQFYMIHRLDGKCKWVVTDSPAFLGAAYCLEHHPQCYIDTLKWYHDQTNSDLNYLISRDESTKFRQAGRVHSEYQSEVIQMRIESLLSTNKIEYTEYDNTNAIHHIVEDIMSIEDDEKEMILKETIIEDVAILGGEND
jgi:thymidylate kinase